MPKPTGRTQPCSRADARTRLDHARKCLDVAQLVTDPGQELEYTSAAAALAVLAGIAAADDACCHALGRRSRGQDHHVAIDLVGQVTPGGTEAATALRRLRATPAVSGFPSSMGGFARRSVAEPSL